MMILPDSEAGVLHARRRVMKSMTSKSTSMLTTAIMIARETSRDGIIPLTFTA
jgi:hypothetical protein